MKPNNPPAFPSATAPSVHGCWGMTLRDYFAAAAITAAAADLRKNLEEGGLTCEFIDEVNAKLLAESCYFISDAMLQCRMSGDPASAAPAAVAGPSQETCQTCQGNGEVITDWERYKHPLPGDVGDEAVAECQDCDGQGTVDAAPTTQAAPAVELGALQAEIAGHEAANLHLSGMVDELRELLQDAKRAMTELHKAAIPDESSEGVPAIIPPDAFRAFVDAHAKLCFCLHQRGHNPAQEGQ